VFEDPDMLLKLEFDGDMLIAECGFSKLAAVFASKPSSFILNRNRLLRESKLFFMERCEADCNANIHSVLSFSV
jgi:hypothetical protein